MHAVKSFTRCAGCTTRRVYISSNITTPHLAQAHGELLLLLLVHRAGQLLHQAPGSAHIMHVNTLSNWSIDETHDALSHLPSDPSPAEYPHLCFVTHRTSPMPRRRETKDWALKASKSSKCSPVPEYSKDDTRESGSMDLTWRRQRREQVRNEYRGKGQWWTSDISCRRHKRKRPRDNVTQITRTNQGR